MRIFTVYAHPDDESFGPSALLATQARRGAMLRGLWLTRGERGQPTRQPPPSPAELAEAREADLREVADLIGYAETEVMDYPDGTLEQLPADEILAVVLQRLRGFRPDVVITFGPAGITRHSDHVAVSRATSDAFERGKAEGLPLHALFYDAVPPDRAAQMGIADAPDGQPNTWIDVSAADTVKLAALRVHARHIADARERANQIAEAGPSPRYPLHRAWPPVPDGAIVHDLMP